MNAKELLNDTNPVVEIDVTNFGKIEVQLFPSVAPITVENFVSYVGFLNASFFQRQVTEGQA